MNKIAVGVSRHTKRQVEGEVGTRDYISGVLLAGHVLMVGDVEEVADQLQLVFFPKREVLGEAQVTHPGRGQSEGIAPDNVNAVCAAGPVDAAAQGAGG